nr:hypothetical protein [Escherichia coli]
MLHIVNIHDLTRNRLCESAERRRQGGYASLAYESNGK